MVIIIGESIARAFGLVGLGSFISLPLRHPRSARRRALVRDDRHRLACGLGLPIMAAVGASLVIALLLIFDAGARQRVVVTIDAHDPARVLVSLTRLFPTLRAVELEGAATATDSGPPSWSSSTSAIATDASKLGPCWKKMA